MYWYLIKQGDPSDSNPDTVKGVMALEDPKQFALVNEFARLNNAKAFRIESLETQHNHNRKKQSYTATYGVPMQDGDDVFTQHYIIDINLNLPLL